MALSERLRWCLTASAAVPVVALGVLVLWARVERNRFAYSLGAGNPEARAARGRELGYQLTSLPLANDGVLHGVLRIPSNAKAPWLLFFPANAEEQLLGTLETLEVLRGGRDLGVAAFTYRGFGGSDGTPSPEAAQTDARAQFAFLQRRFGVNSHRLVLAGFSMGSGVALNLAAELSREGHKTAGLILLSPYTRLRLKRPNAWGWWLPGQRYETESAARDYPGPTLVIAAAEDGALPPEEHAEPLVRKLRGKVTYELIPGSGHGDYLSDRAALEPAIEFLQGA